MGDEGLGIGNGLRAMRRIRYNAKSMQIKFDTFDTFDTAIALPLLPTLRHPNGALRTWAPF